MQKFPLFPLCAYSWCVQKCPYCDFNSHAQKGAIPEQEYVQHLIADLEADLRNIRLVFKIVHSIQFLLVVARRVYFQRKVSSCYWQKFNVAFLFREYWNNYGSQSWHCRSGAFQRLCDAGVTRISMGIQSFNDDKLQRLGRIHNAAEAKSAVSLAKVSGLKSFNLDLMHGLPKSNAWGSL